MNFCFTYIGRLFFYLSDNQKYFGCHDQVFVMIENNCNDMTHFQVCDTYLKKSSIRQTRFFIFETLIVQHCYCAK